MKTRYVITKIDKSGLCTLATANQGRCFKDTREEAEAQLAAMLANNSADTLKSVYGDTSKMKVRAVECYDNGDATRTVFEDEKPIRAKLNRRERKAAQLLAHYATCERLALALGMPAAKVDGKKISVALWKIERDAHNAATAQCNGEAYNGQPWRSYESGDGSESAWERFEREIRERVAAVFGGIAPAGLFVNTDARGYALKIDNEKREGRALIEAVKLHTDWGGFGILSPEIDGSAR